MKWHGHEIVRLRHRYNCQINDPVNPPPGGALGWWLLNLRHRLHGVPTNGMRSSERAIEVPLAIDFLSSIVQEDAVIELGCVLPYYILKANNHRVYDLMDAHPENTKRDIREIPDEELRTNIISISTLEHIGQSEYGITAADNAPAVAVLKRILANARHYFITFPLGHNKELDDFVLSTKNLNSIFVTRKSGDPENWTVVEMSALTDEMKRENTYLRANTICVLEKR